MLLSFFSSKQSLFYCAFFEFNLLLFSNFFSYMTQSAASDYYEQKFVVKWNEGNPLYQIYRNAGPSSDLIVPACALFLVSICGMAMNSFVVLVTVKKRSLRGTANFLIALICVFEVVHQSGHILFFVVVVTGINFIGSRTADLFLTPLIIASNANMFAMFGVAIDRLFAIVAPFWHKKVEILHKKEYLSAHCFVYALFSFYSLYYVLAFDYSHFQIPTTGLISELYATNGPRKEVGTKFFAFATLLNTACIVCYALIFLHIKCKKGVSKETNTRLLRSLVTILLISVGGYLINLMAYQLVFSSLLNFSAIHVWQLAAIPGILLNIGAASNALILFKNSTEYRKVFMKELIVLVDFFCQNNERFSVPATAAVIVPLPQYVSPVE